MGKWILFFLGATLHVLQGAEPEGDFKYLQGGSSVIVMDMKSNKIHYLYDDGRNETKIPHSHPHYAIITKNESDTFYKELRKMLLEKGSIPKLLRKPTSKVE
jgi:hypothetical protein